MIRSVGAIFIAGMITPGFAKAAPDAGELQQKSDQQVAAPDEGINRQILQTLKDIRDSQLSVLQAQVEILSILRSQDKTAATAHGHGAESVSGRRTGGAKMEANSSTSVARTSRSATR